VADVAMRWGLVHTGKFAAAYRRAYGESPSETLRGVPRRPKVSDSRENSLLLSSATASELV
jgi:AraC-like DNA-binding protein